VPFIVKAFVAHAFIICTFVANAFHGISPPAVLLQLLRTDSTNAEAYAVHGRGLYLNADFPQAEKYLREALRLNPDMVLGGRLLKQVGRVVMVCVWRLLKQVGRVVMMMLVCPDDVGLLLVLLLLVRSVYPHPP
jgi:hypothetical protein